MRYGPALERQWAGRQPVTNVFLARWLVDFLFYDEMALFSRLEWNLYTKTVKNRYTITLKRGEGGYRFLKFAVAEELRESDSHIRLL